MRRQQIGEKGCRSGLACLAASPHSLNQDLAAAATEHSPDQSLPVQQPPLWSTLPTNPHQN